MQVLGRRPGDGPEGPVGHLGTYRARDGSAGGRVGVDLDRPHAAAVVGKRGSGKSYTLGVLAEALAGADGVTPVVVDPMGAFGSLAAVGARVVDRPRVPSGALPPPAWPDLVGLDPSGPAGSLVWRAAAAANSLAGMAAFVADADVRPTTRRAAENHLRLAASWDVFDGATVGADAVGGRAVVFDLSGLPRRPANAVCRAVVRWAYERCLAETVERLPWLLVDEAHVFFEGLATPALRRVLTRGRTPGVSLVVATQRPSALPPVVASQADLLVVHRLTDRADREALAAARPSYLDEAIADRLPTTPGHALVVDDATERAHALAVRERETAHHGTSRRATGRAAGPRG